MHICYVEESGESGVLNLSDANSNPFFIVIGLFVDYSGLSQLTQDFLKAKIKFFPATQNSVAHFLDCIEVERKGGDIRKAIRSSSRRCWQQSVGFTDFRCNRSQ
jgi:hypothetical protein